MYGLQVSSAAYRHRLNKFQISIEASLVTLIYNKCLNISSQVPDDGRALTLMSSDVESVSHYGEMFHETWAQLIEVLVGLFLLSREVSWLFPVPIVIIFCKKCLF